MASKSINITIPNINALNIQVKLEGNWNKLDRLADRLQPSVMKGYQNGISKFSKRLLIIVRRSIMTGTPPTNSGVTWEPLAQGTIERYGEHPIYNLTGTYLRSVGLHQYKSRTLIGLPINIGRINKQGRKITLNAIAKILEFGSNNIPARPLWEPSFKSIGGRKALKKELLENIRSSLLKDVGIRPNQIK